MKIKRILIANRGEIALRIISTLKKLNIKSIAVFSEADKDDWHVTEADEAYSLGEGSLEQTWLNVPLIIDIAKQSGADAIHPGYGFLSENATFARACEEAGIIFIGPQSHVIEKMGSKLVAARYAKEAGIPLLPLLKGHPNTWLEMLHHWVFPFW